MANASSFQSALAEYSYLDLTADIVNGALEQLGGGGFSDVFRSKLRRAGRLGKTKHDPHIEQLLAEIEAESVESANAKSNPGYLIVAVKRLRFWGKPIPKVEKVYSIFLSTTNQTELIN